MSKLRRTMMFVPGNNAGMLKEAHIYGADSLMFDLEDSVALSEKDTARFLVSNIIKSVDFEGNEIVVRVNPLDSEWGRDDLEAMVRAGVHVIRLPKAESAKDVIETEKVISEIETKCGREAGSTRMMAAIEDPLGAMNAYSIATSSKRLIAIALGAEDYVRSMKTRRYPDGNELFGARSAVVMAARAAGIYAIDTVFSNVDDEEGLRRETELIKQLGFDGKSVINPRQIPVVHEIFNPTTKEIEEALKIKEAIAIAHQKGSGVISLNGKMIDRPIVDRADRVLEIAKASGLYREGMK